MKSLRQAVQLLSISALGTALQALSTWTRERIQLEDASIFFRVSASGKPPLLLVHGFPEDSHTWDTIGPILAQNYTVIAPDNRGCGQSQLSISDNYTAYAAGQDLAAILAFLNINKTYVFAHDKGGGLAVSLAFEHPDLVVQLAIAEYPLPGTPLYSTAVRSPILSWDWQLAFFSVPDAAEFFIRGREKEMLAWYFYHGSYSGNDVYSNDLVEYYTRTISKPGFLRSGMQYFASAFEDGAYFQQKLNTTGKLNMPVLFLGGEASLGAPFLLQEIVSTFAQSYSTAVVPKAGHWIGVENPVWVANRIGVYMAQATSPIPSVDLSWLENTITMLGNDGANMGMLTAGVNRTGIYL